MEIYLGILERISYCLGLGLRLTKYDFIKDPIYFPITCTPLSTSKQIMSIYQLQNIHTLFMCDKQSVHKLKKTLLSSNYVLLLDHHTTNIYYKL